MGNSFVENLRRPPAQPQQRPYSEERVTRQVNFIPAPGYEHLAPQPPPPEPEVDEGEDHPCFCGRCFGGPVHCGSWGGDFDKPDVLMAGDPDDTAERQLAEFRRVIPKDDLERIETAALIRDIEAADREAAAAAERLAQQERAVRAEPYRLAAVNGVAEKLRAVATIFAQDHPEDQ